MRKVWLVLKREYGTRVRTKGFVIGTLALPVLVVALLAFSVFMAERTASQPVKLAILDEAGGLAQAVAAGLNQKLPNGQPAFRIVDVLEGPVGAEAEQGLSTKVQQGELDAYILLPPDAVQSGRAEFRAGTAGDFSMLHDVTAAVNSALIARRLRDRGIHLEDLRNVVRGAEVKLVKVSKEGVAEEKGQTFVIAMAVPMILYTTLLIYGVITMRSVLEEKTTRTVEVLVSSIRPSQLLAGKILGVAAVGFTQYLIWMGCAGLVAGYGRAMAVVVRPGVSLPSLHLPLSLLVYTVIFFLGGYFLYSALYAAVGAAVSSESDAQQMQWPVTLPLVLSVVMFVYVLREPNTTPVVILSEIPFFAPILMLVRIAAHRPPFWQIGLSIGLLAVTTMGVVRLAARIYRVGLLMYGKRPSLAEVIRWFRYA